MNQILVTEKLYITPELRRKKKIYKNKILFIRFFNLYIMWLLHICREW